MTLDPISMVSLATAAFILLMMMVLRRRQSGAGSRRSPRMDAIDTVLGWQPEAARVLSVPEMQALALLQKALPGCLVLAQVPLSRFLRVPTRNSYADWLARVGKLNADLLLCGSDSRVLAVIDVRAPQEGERSRRRHERMVRVLRAAGIAVHVWRHDQMPTAIEVRAQFDALLSGTNPRAAVGLTAGSSTSRPMPLRPGPDIEALLAEGDARAAAADLLEPVASDFFDDLETVDAHR